MSDSQERSEKQQRVHNSRSLGSSERVGKSVADVIVIVDSDGSECHAPHDFVVREDQAIERDVSPRDPMRTKEKLDGIFRAIPFVTVLEGDWDICDCIQVHICTKLLRCLKACAQIYLEQSSVLLKDGFRKDVKSCMHRIWDPLLIFITAFNFPELY